MNVIVMLLVLIGVTTSAEPEKEIFPRTVLNGVELPQLGPIGTYYPIEDGEIFVINSPGGIIDSAFMAGIRLQGKTCIVKHAASAALQILLPFCKHRYFLPDAMVQFHSSHVMYTVLGTIMFSMWDAQEMADKLSEHNTRMIQHMIASGIPLLPQEILEHARKETIWRAPELGKLGTWIQPIQECKHCPEALREVGKPPAPKRKIPKVRKGDQRDVTLSPN